MPGLWSHWSSEWKSDDRRFVYDNLLVNYEDFMNENVSDQCVNELLTNRSRNGCDISHDCWTTMTRKGYGDYQLSHEIFYLSLGIKVSADLIMPLNAIDTFDVL